MGGKIQCPAGRLINTRSFPEKPMRFANNWNELRLLMGEKAWFARQKINFRLCGNRLFRCWSGTMKRSVTFHAMHHPFTSPKPDDTVTDYQVGRCSRERIRHGNQRYRSWWVVQSVFTTVKRNR